MRLLHDGRTVNHAIIIGLPYDYRTTTIRLPYEYHTITPRLPPATMRLPCGYQTITMPRLY
eukprot:3975436-Pyramimonas_sp.AAC.1